MNTKKIIAVALAAGMLVSLTACGGGSSSKKYSKALDDIGYKNVDPEDSEDALEDDIEDGFYVELTDADDLEDFCEGFEMFDADDANSAVVAERETDEGTFMVMVVNFKDTDSAEDFFEDAVEVFEDYDEDEDDVDCKIVDEDDTFQLAYVYENEDWEIYMGVFADVQIHGKTVTYIVCMTNDEDSDIMDDIADFYDGIGEDCPVDLL